MAHSLFLHDPQAENGFYIRFTGQTHKRYFMMRKFTWNSNTNVYEETLTKTQPHSSVYILSRAALEIFPIWCFLENVYQPWFRTLSLTSSILTIWKLARNAILGPPQTFEWEPEMESSILCFLQAFSVTLMQGELWESPVQKNTKMKNIWSCNLKKRGTIAFSDVRAEGMKLNNNKK